MAGQKLGPMSTPLRWWAPSHGSRSEMHGHLGAMEGWEFFTGPVDPRTPETHSDEVLGPPIASRLDMVTPSSHLM